MRSPDYEGSGPKAWNLALPPTHPTSLGAWLIFAPGAHPAWRYHIVSLVHLRPTEGFPEAKLTAPGNTHEFQVLALDPACEETLDADKPDTFKYLMPPDVIEQIAVSGDEVAMNIARSVIQRCIDGILIPDSDYRAVWSAQLRSLAHTVKT